jgi:medium-chain acyl-[acyl-carrier-protein] hydrolase
MEPTKAFIPLSKPSGVTTHRLFCFHWAGSNANAFRSWASTFQSSQYASSLELYGVTWRNLKSERYKAVTEIAEGLGLRPQLSYFYIQTTILTKTKTLLSELKIAINSLNLLDNVKIIFFGHSLGALVAFELVRLLEIDGIHAVTHLIVSAVKHPRCLTEGNEDESQIKTYQLPDNKLFSYVEAIGGLPPGVHPDFLRLALKAIREDYFVFNTYTFVEGRLITCPVTSMGGTIDTTSNLESLLPWTEYTSNEHNHVQFGDFSKGDHFYLNDPSLKADVLETIISICHNSEFPDENTRVNFTIGRRYREVSIHPFVSF